MSTWKSARDDDASRPAEKEQPPETDAENPPAPQVEVTSLEIDAEAEFDCDPYNRTGQHLVDAIRRYKD